MLFSHHASSLNSDKQRPKYAIYIKPWLLILLWKDNCISNPRNFFKVFKIWITGKKKKIWLTGLKKGERRWLSAILVLKCQASSQRFNIGRQQEMFWKFSTSKLLGQTLKINYIVMTCLVNNYHHQNISPWFTVFIQNTFTYKFLIHKSCYEKWITFMKMLCKH